MADTPTGGANADLGNTSPTLPEMSYDEAFSRKQERLADPAWREKYMAGDVECRAEMDRIVRGLTPKQAMPTDPANVEQAIDWLRSFADIREDIVQQVRDRVPVTPYERRAVEQLKEKLFRDKEWVKRYLDGDREARTQVGLITIVLSSPVSRSTTIGEIDVAWSVAKEQLLAKIRHDTPKQLADQIRRQAEERALIDVYGEGFKRDKNGKPISQGLGSPDNQTRQSVDAYEKWGKNDPHYHDNLAKMRRELAVCEARRKAEGIIED